MVTVSTRPESGSRMVLEIEVSPAEVDRHFATAYRHVAERTKVPGFRPGKAPRHVIDRFVGRASVIAEAVEHLVNESYDAALDEAAIVPIDQPEVDLDSAAVAEGAIGGTLIAALTGLAMGALIVVARLIGVAGGADGLRNIRRMGNFFV